ncbi:hypothetical protein M231_07901 [Tremella mesenterica]|uniref:Alpha-type protein kinase domain-containing protein n=1 Tax=Tremella mesenterica TaxID=5217 RepID=A0A4Q1B803_TREME|nr:hypothetical protein M231_07901 [Tremella mesenterica]
MMSVPRSFASSTPSSMTASTPASSFPSTVRSLAVTKANNAAGAREGLGVCAIVLTSVSVTALSKANSYKKSAKWPYEIPSFRAEWHTALKDVFETAWTKVVEAWNGAGQGQEVYNFDIESSDRFEYLHTPHGENERVNVDDFKKYTTLSHFFRQEYLSAHAVYGRKRDTKSSRIVIHFEVRAPRESTLKRELSDSSNDHQEPVSKKTCVEDNQPVASEPLMAEETLQALQDLQQTLIENELLEANEGDEQEVIYFHRIYADPTTDDLDPIQAEMMETGRLDRMWSEHGAFKLIYHLHVGKNHWVAKRHYSMIFATDPDEHTVILSEAQHFHLNFKEVQKATQLKLWAEDFHQEVQWKSERRERRDSSFKVTEAFVIQEAAPTDGREHPRSWIVEQCLTEQPASAHPLKTWNSCFVKWSNIDYVAPKPDDYQLLTKLILEDLDAWIHWVFETSNRTLIPADIQGFLTSVGKVPATARRSFILFDLLTHTLPRDSGPGDCGYPKLHRFVHRHKCNTVCVALGLDNMERAKPSSIVPVQEEPHPTELPFWRKDEMKERGWVATYKGSDVLSEDEVQEAYNLIPSSPPPIPNLASKRLDMTKFWPF